LLEKNQDAELVEIVRREMRRIDSIVSQMLKFAAPAKPSFSAIRMHDILEHSLRLVQSKVQSGAIALHRSYSAAPDLIGGDDYQLEQAFVNLFLNALEAMGPNGELFVSTEVGPGRPLNGLSNGAPEPKCGSQSGTLEWVSLLKICTGCSSLFLPPSPMARGWGY